MKRHNINNFKEAELALRPYVPLVSELTGKDTVLDRIQPLMEHLGSPHQKLRTIHLAGTSGKTSTSYYIAGLLVASGKKVGLTVSPHIDKISERTQINGRPLDEQIFCDELSIFLELVEQTNIRPSYFELLYAFSIWLFAKYEVDYAVIETGMGGLFDATNIVNREDKVCVITDIGYDHMHILGDTIAKITAQKVGIVHEHNPLLMYDQSVEVMDVIKSWVKDHDASLHLTTQEKETGLVNRELLSDLADYQKRNWLLAYFAYRFVAKRDKLKELSTEQLSSVINTKIPARMDTIQLNGKTLVMDGAHNQQKMEAFVSSFKHKYPNQKPTILLSFKTGKDYMSVLPLFKDFAEKIIITTFNTSQDLPAKAANPNHIASELKRLRFTNYVIEPDIHEAYKLLLEADSKLLVISGSFYLIAQLREEDIKID